MVFAPIYIKTLGKKKYKPKTYVIGDLHGAHRAFVDLLKKVQFNFELDTLVFLGDLADGWGEFHYSLKVFKKIKNFYAVIGNHDMYLLKYLRTGIAPEKWLKIGGDVTLDVINNNPEVVDDLEEYFSKAKYFHILDGKLYCHGGLNHNRTIVGQRKSNFAINRQMYGIAKKYMRQKLRFEILYDSKNSIEIDEIFIGHSTTKNLKPDTRANLTNVDTGAGSIGFLTIMNVYTKKYNQSRRVSDLYK